LFYPFTASSDSYRKSDSMSLELINQKLSLLKVK
jgi:hypothetical protein